MPTMPGAPYTVYQTYNGILPWPLDQQTGRCILRKNPLLSWNTVQALMVKIFTTSGLTLLEVCQTVWLLSVLGKKTYRWMYLRSVENALCTDPGAR
jgi:hypothetical protein